MEPTVRGTLRDTRIPEQIGNHRAESVTPRWSL